MGSSPLGDSAAVRRGVAANLLAGLIVIGSNLLAVPLGIAAGGVAPYGAWVVAFSVILLLSQADLGLGSGLVRQLSYLRSAGGPSSREGNTAWVGMALFAVIGVVGAVVVLAIGPAYFAVSSTQLDDRVARDIVLAAAVGVCLGAINRYFIAVVQSHLDFWAERLATVVGQVARILVLGVAVVLNGGIQLVIIADVASLGLTAVLCAAYVYGRRRPPAGSIREGMRGDLKSLLSFSLPTFLSSFSTLFAMQAPLWIVGVVLGFGNAAGFGAITRIYQSSRTVLGWITGPLLPAASSATARREPSILASLHWGGIAMCTGVGAAILAVFAVQGSAILELWLGDEFTYLSVTLSIIGCAILLNSIYAPGVVVATGAGRPGLVAGYNVIVLSITLLGSLLGTQTIGVVGAAVAIALGVAVVFPFSQWRTSSISGLRPSCSLALAILASAAVVAVAYVASLVAGDLSPTPRICVVGVVSVAAGAAAALALLRVPATWVTR